METIDKYAKVLVGIVGLVLYAASLTMAYEHGLTVAQAKGDRALSELQRQQAQASVSALSGTFQGYVANVARGQQAEGKFVLAVSASDTQKSILKGAIDAVSQPRHERQPVASDRIEYRCVFSNGFVRLWNAAAGLDAGHGGLPDSAPVAGTEHDSGEDAAIDSGVSQADLLDWFVDYSNRARHVESQLNGVIDAYPNEE
ncbi:hypothetical protein PCA31118_00026 [Pandoraea captiosa]|uniref:Uncharacterized protein n=1 Tax=Pandoraea captiosa TaxID=2508302 RepID=A0A5E4ZHM1_9BURK|nr:hypothetical protein [Pandoraea captiosa]VVE59820.1 hypothetical protein PCA31118_00026 [Pandoraea captiosa]